MAMLETAVVIYLRKIYYPEGFSFPLNPIDASIVLTEIAREAATMIMLLGIAILAAEKKNQRFAYFLYSFAIWDIFYYVFLKIFINWPESLLTWDILFLIPVTWVGPVIAPIICSIMMILLAILILLFSNSQKQAGLNSINWLFLVLGSLVVVISFVEDYVSYMSGSFSYLEIFTMQNSQEVMDYAAQYIPNSFAWYTFSAGIIIIGIGIFTYTRRFSKTSVK